LRRVYVKEDKEYAIDVIKKQLVEAKRDAIAKRAKEAMANLKKGLVKKGTVKDLYKPDFALKNAH